MKTKKFRLFALWFSIALLLDAPFGALASYVTIPEDMGKTLYLEITAWETVTQPVDDYRRIWHEGNCITDIEDYGDYEATILYEHTGTDYPSALIDAMVLESCYPSYSVSGTYDELIQIPADDLLGYYTLAVIFDVKAGGWSVSQGVLFPGARTGDPIETAPIETGTLYYAPRRTVNGYCVVPVP